MEGTSKIDGKFNVGGVLLDRPFKIRRLGHFGYNSNRVEDALAFYRDMLGFRVTDPLDFAKVVPVPHMFDGLGPTVGYFMTHGTDHHSHVVFPKPVMDKLNLHQGNPHPEVTTNQITWQVGTLREVGGAIDWFKSIGINPGRIGRDVPGSNWHSYPPDPEGHINELYYGIEQIGWNLQSKPPEVKKRGFREKPELPQMCEYQELDMFHDEGMDMRAGFRHRERLPFKYDVGGVTLARPFKVIKIGPVRLFVHDVAKCLEFYTRILGLRVTEEIDWEGHRCVFLRCNTEHHSLALYPIALRAKLGLSPHTTCMSFGNQVGDYGQLRNAVDFLKANGVTIKYLPPELFPGIDYSAFAVDPDGHTVQLYYYMEQVGWDGRVRPKSDRRRVDNARWPEAVPPMSDTFDGETLLGPLG
jgi:catechol 2,3-dioxygenase-like lactoylglutathione lyase family enzyme